MKSGNKRKNGGRETVVENKKRPSEHGVNACKE